MGDGRGERGESWGNTAYRLFAGVSLFVSETTEKYCCVCLPWSFPCFNNFQLGNETEPSKSFRLHPGNESWLKSVIWFELEARLRAQAESVSCLSKLSPNSRQKELIKMQAFCRTYSGWVNTDLRGYWGCTVGWLCAINLLTVSPLEFERVLAVCVAFIIRSRCVSSTRSQRWWFNPDI